MFDDHPFVEAQPPTTDAITYLMLLEYNLTRENLPVLEHVLQGSVKLTQDIGWDLLALLLPLLPESQTCVDNIAKNGNPREVILKGVEALNEIRGLEADLDARDETSRQNSPKLDQHPALRESTPPLAATDTSARDPQNAEKFQTLLRLLAVLHGRLKAKAPSRFLSTTLAAVLGAYAEVLATKDSQSYTSSVTFSVIAFARKLSEQLRPSLPPRNSSFSSEAAPLPAGVEVLSPDPEAPADRNNQEIGESAIQKKLFQAFITKITEIYSISLDGTIDDADADTPGLAWTSRLQEYLEPQKVVPHRKTYTRRFSENKDLKERDGVIAALQKLSVDLGLRPKVLLSQLSGVLSEQRTHQQCWDAEDPPETALDISLSSIGVLILYTESIVREILSGSSAAGPNLLKIFPYHAQLLNCFISTASSQTPSTAMIGTEPYVVIDSILALGVASKSSSIEPLQDEDEFTAYLQIMSLLSANCPSPSLRYHAHELVSTVLHSHSNDLLRLAFIKDTLQNSPVEALKASAIGWLKTEILTTDMQNQSFPQEEAHAQDASQRSPKNNVFATPVSLETLSSQLFPDVRLTFLGPSIPLAERWATFKSEFSTHLAVLNLYYVLVSRTSLRSRLGVLEFHKETDIGGGFLGPLREASLLFQDGLGLGEGQDANGELALVEGNEGVSIARMDILLLEDAIGKVESALLEAAQNS